MSVKWSLDPWLEFLCPFYNWQAFCFALFFHIGGEAFLKTINVNLSFPPVIPLFDCHPVNLSLEVHLQRTPGRTLRAVCEKAELHCFFIF